MSYDGLRSYSAQACTCMLQEYAKAAKCRGDEVSASVAKDLRQGLVNLPCDVVHTPSTMRSAIERVSATLPKQSAFALLYKAQRDLRRAEEQLCDVGEDS